MRTSTSPPGASELPTADLQDRYSYVVQEFLNYLRKYLKIRRFHQTCECAFPAAFENPAKGLEPWQLFPVRRASTPQSSIPALRPGHFSQLSPGRPQRIYFWDSCSKQEHFEDFLRVLLLAKRKLRKEKANQMNTI